jgi:glutathione S-transferase
VLIDDDVVVYDSTVILEYLEDRHPDPPLRPRDPAGRARCRRLELEADEVLFPHVWDLIETGFYGSAAADAARAAAARECIAEFQARLEKELGDRPYLCGEYGVADIATSVMLNAAAALGAPPAAALTSLGAWLSRVRERPAVRRESDEMNAYAAKALARRS